MPLIKANRIFVVAFVATAVLLPKQSDAQNESTVRRPMGSVIFVRHGESEWNTLHMHTGWYNTALTKTGKIMTFSLHTFASMRPPKMSVEQVLTTYLLRRQTTSKGSR